MLLPEPLLSCLPLSPAQASLSCTLPALAALAPCGALRPPTFMVSRAVDLSPMMRTCGRENNKFDSHAHHSRWNAGARAAPEPRLAKSLPCRRRATPTTSRECAECGMACMLCARAARPGR